ncbi:hypothetical protein [Desulfosporosinus metallidurans]|uniref:hypothetical protein n=1 Tax=Desulfosporosinus metallidurans TaxID=1888891 RepID=UPI00147FF6FE|nr:hypothetical protein [Desulfosporosinus metallidurans]
MVRSTIHNYITQVELCDPAISGRHAISHNWGTAKKAAYGCLKPVTTNRFRRAYRHLGYSIVLTEHILAQVTHTPEGSFRAYLPIAL